MKIKKIVASLFAAGVVASPLAHATNGYFSHGYGMKAKGMAGVGIALPQDSIAAATNPAGMVMVGDRIDFGLDYFRPVRSATTSGYSAGVGNPPFQMLPLVAGVPTPGASAEFSGNGDASFLIPEFGYNKMINANSSFGVSVYGNGGMNTNYASINAGTAGPPPPAPAGLGVFGPIAQKAGVDLSQLFIAPTYSTMITPDNALGASLNLVRQSISVYGIQNFQGVSSNGAAVSNNGYDSSNGWGLKLGWIGKITQDISLGATYQSKTKMGKFSKYSGLFAEQGGFDIPETYGIGISAKTTPDLTLAADIQQINYSKVPSVGNSVNNLLSSCNKGGLPGVGTTGCLGDSNGAGFGWRDMTVFKLGASYAYSQNLTLRGGISTTRQPIPTNETFFNVIAPAVIQNHLTLGATWTLNKGELTVGYMHAYGDSVNGTNTTVGGKGVGLKMYEDSIGIAYGWKM